MSVDGPAIDLKGVGQIGLYVTDLEEAARFYREVLGMPELMRIPGSVFFDCGGVRVMLGERNSPAGEPSPHAAEAGPGTIIYYEVADLDGAHRRLTAHGAAIVREPHLVARFPDHELWMLFAEDPSGNLFALTSNMSLSGSGGG